MAMARFGRASRLVAAGIVRVVEAPGKLTKP